MLSTFQNKVAFITGGASGIGLGIARSLAREGMKIAIADIEPETLATAAANIRALGAEVMTLPLDVSRWENWEGVPERVEATLGPVSVLCNNAGISLVEQPAAEAVIVDWQKLFSINVHGVLYGVRAFAGRMGGPEGGHIVNTSSSGGLTAIGHPGLSAYVASKFAVVGMSEVLQSEMAPKNVGVSVLCPGQVRSELWRTSRKVRGVPLPEEPSARELKGSRAPDAMDPDEVGSLVVQAIRADRLYIVTHASRRAPIRARQALIEEAFEAIPTV